MKFENIDINELLPDAKNPRKDLKPDDPEFNKITTSIEKFGFLEPIVFNTRTKKILGGHQRIKTLKHRGVSELHIIKLGAYSWGFTDDELKELTPSEENAANIALNKAQGDWDMDQLMINLQELKDEDFDIELTGFDDLELDTLLIDMDKLDDSFTLPDGDKEFTTISFTLTDEQSIFIKEQINFAKKRLGDTSENDNKNGNGNALFLVVTEWSAQKK